MRRLFQTLIRGAAAEVEEAVLDQHALRILEQQIRDAAAAIEAARRELACAMAHRSAEARAADALAARISELEDSAGKALAAGRDDLAAEAATVIAATEDERIDRRAAIERMDTEIFRLRQLADDGRKRLAELRRGHELARAQEALRRAGASGRRALASGAGAIREAEATLNRIRERQLGEDDCAAALDALERQSCARDLDDRLAEAGFGPRLKTRPADVLARLRAKTGSPAPAAGAVPPPASALPQTDGPGSPPRS